MFTLTLTSHSDSVTERSAVRRLLAKGSKFSVTFLPHDIGGENIQYLNRFHSVYRTLQGFLNIFVHTVLI